MIEASALPVALLGKVNHLQEIVTGVVLLHFISLHHHLTLVRRCIWPWDGFAHAGPPPFPSNEPELQTQSLSLFILDLFKRGDEMCQIWGVEMCSSGGGKVSIWGVEMCQIWGVEMCWDEVNYYLKFQRTDNVLWHSHHHQPH